MKEVEVRLVFFVSIVQRGEFYVGEVGPEFGLLEVGVLFEQFIELDQHLNLFLPALSHLIDFFIWSIFLHHFEEVFGEEHQLELLGLGL